MKFYDCSTAPSPRRVRIVMAEKGLHIETVQVDLAHGEHMGEAFREINPDCTVPVLELDDGRTISEVLAICSYLDERFPEVPLMGRDPEERAQVLMWTVKVEQQGLAAIAEMFRNRAKGFRGRALTGPHAVEQIPQLVERGLQRLEWFFDRLDGQLAQRKYLLGDYFSFADISAFVAVEFAGWSKVAIGDHRPALLDWHGRVAARPSASA